MSGDVLADWNRQGLPDRRRGPVMKRAVRISVMVLIVLLAGLIAARLFLSSQFVADEVAAQLADIYGGRVELKDARIGLVGDSTIGGVRLYEAGGAPEPWLTAHSIKADLSALGLLSGDTMPDQVTVSGATISLRFGKTGRLLTQLPHGRVHGKGGSYPDVRVQGSRLILHQGDRPDLVLEGIDAELSEEGSQLLVRGTIDDPTWGRWRVSAQLPRVGRGLSATLQTNGKVHVTLAMLKSLPFVPPSVWKAVQVEDDTPAEVTLRYDPQTHDVHYRVDVQPTSADVCVPEIGLKARRAHGQTQIEDGVVRLRDVEGQAYGGTLRTSADLDFQGSQTRLHFFKLRVQQVKVDELQRHWTFPVNGRLSGEADMEFILTGGKVETRGQGRGVITENRLGGPVHIELHGGPGGFKLHEPQNRRTTGHRTSPVRRTFPTALVPAEAGPQPESGPTLPARLANLANAGLAALTKQTIQAGQELARVLASEGKGKPPTRPASLANHYLETSLRMDDVNLAQFLEGVGLHLPFAVSGQFSFAVTIGIPTSATGNLKAYRATGTATASHLEVAGLRFEQLRARVNYRNGVLTLDELRAHVPGVSANKAASSTSLLRGTARMGLAPMGDLTAEVALEKIPLAPLVRALAAAPEPVDGKLSGTVTARVPVKKIGSIAAWNVSGTVAAPRVRVLDWTATDVIGEINVQEGVASLRNARLRIQGAPVAGFGRVRLESPFAYRAQVSLADWDLANLRRLVPQVRPPVDVEGTAQTTADLHGTLRPMDVRVSGTSLAAGLKLAGVSFQSLRVGWSAEADRLKLTSIKAKLYEGQLSGQAVVLLKRDAAGTVALRFDRIDVAALTRAIPKNPIRLTGRADGTLNGTIAPAARAGDRSARFDLDLSAPQLRIQGIPAERVQGNIRYRSGKVAYRLHGQTLGGRFNLQGQLPPARSAPDGPNGQGRRYLIPNAEGVAQQSPGSRQRTLGGQGTNINPNPEGVVQRSQSLCSTPSGLVDGWGSGSPRVCLRDPGLCCATPSALENTGGIDKASRVPVIKLIVIPISMRLVQAPAPPVAPGRLQLEGIQLERLWEALGLEQSLGFLRGRADLDLPFQHEGLDMTPVGTGKLSLSRLRWYDTELAGDITSDVVLGRQELRLNNVTGTLGEGQLTARLGISLRPGGRSWFDVRLTGIEAARLLPPWPRLAGLVQGRFDAHLRSTIGPEWLGSGRILLARGKLGSLDVTDWHLPLDWTLAPTYGRGEVHVRESTLNLAQGRVSGRSTFTFGGGNHLQGQISFLGVDLRALLRELGETSQIGTGKLTGRFDFSGADVRSLADLSGTLEATLSQVQSADLPILRQLTPYLRSGLTAASTFSTGRLRATLSRNVFRIQRWVMIANLFQLVIEGNVITDGRLDLQVTGIPGSLGADPNSLGILQRVPVAGPISVGLLAQVSRFLGTRFIHLRVTGTVRNPNIRYEPQFGLLPLGR
jgi:hypothetical protein